jgi:co-chaperonin GroES (HSP10)
MIKPLGNKIQLEIADEKIGAIQSESIQEKGVIVAVGPNAVWADNSKPKIGATLYFKAWAIDIITEDGKKYYFISSDSDAICAISK